MNIRIAGEAGQGVQTAGDLLVHACSSLGLHLLSTQSYMSRIRGGLNWYDVRVSEGEVWSGAEQADLLVALTPEALAELRGQLAPGGLILYDGEGDDGVVSVRLQQLAREVAGNTIMANAVAAGAVFAVLGYDVELLADYLRGLFEHKGATVADQNAACARRGAAAVASQAGALPGPPPAAGPREVTDGATAFALGACTAGVKFVSAYPMSPSTAVLNSLATHGERYGVLVEQVEDEIAALNMCCGATYAGVPALVTTSGGGFALMVEALSLAGMLELPTVVLLAMRPGPATGLPTRTGQEDLRFVLSAGHGEFPRAVYAPGSLPGAYAAARHALAAAHRYQTPAIVLMDQFLIDLHATVPPLDETYRPVSRELVSADAGYQRYRLTDTGVSPRAIPGGEAFVVCDSDEHTEDGHLTEDLQVRVQMVDKRLRKEQGLCREALTPEWYGPSEAPTLLICWGSTYGPCREAVDRLNRQRPAAAMLHFSQVWPLPLQAAVEALAGERRLICVEGNARGQFAGLLRETGLVRDCELLLKYDGMPFTGEEIARRVTL